MISMACSPTNYAQNDPLGRCCNEIHAVIEHVSMLRDVSEAFEDGREWWEGRVCESMDAKYGMSVVVVSERKAGVAFVMSKWQAKARGEPSRAERRRLQGWWCKWQLLRRWSRRWLLHFTNHCPRACPWCLLHFYFIITLQPHPLCQGLL